MLLAHVYLLSNRAAEGENLYQAVIDTYHNSGNKEGRSTRLVQVGIYY